MDKCRPVYFMYDPVLDMLRKKECANEYSSTSDRARKGKTDDTS
jgi:hypothetical protein